MAITAPSGLAVSVLSSSKIALSWVNEGEYHLIQVWQNIGGAGYVNIDNIHTPLFIHLLMFFFF